MTGQHEGTGLRNTLKERRSARGWSQEDLAHAVGVSRKTINTVERGR
ncbi:MAG: helix-turn-helix domain-containing protein, partial [Pseudomonadota bacterium]